MDNLKVKDYVFLGIVGALYSVLFFAITFGASYIAMLGAFGHVISPAFFALIGGTIIVFIAHKCGKFPAYTILSLITMFLTIIMGSFYLPWFLTVTIATLMADLISKKRGYSDNLALYTSFSLMTTGQIIGGIIPVWFFVDAYRTDWIQRGMTPEGMDEMIHAASGVNGIYAIIIGIIMAIIGITIGRKLLEKHFA